ncbi:MAG TPA: hypothetical protein VFG23_07755 [Polyangia bacterium]|nr:hypothetical protein [Polyangia bacterium]
MAYFSELLAAFEWPVKTARPIGGSASMAVTICWTVMPAKLLGSEACDSA